MSIGSLLGGIGGGIIGFFFGGPTGAYYGAALGFGIGMAVDPITPDIPAQGIPDPEEQVMQSVIGTPIPDLCGTAKITGNLLFFGNERNVKQYSESPSGSKGGSEPEPQVTGYKYYMSWGVSIIACPDNPVDAIYAIYGNDDAEPVWEDEDGLLLPASGGQETILLDDIGTLEFFYGTDDQMPIDDVGEIIGDSTLNTPYRRLCWAYFDDCYIGSVNRTPTYTFVIKKIPQVSAITAAAEIQGYDSNPAHALYYILNRLSGLPETWLNTNDFNSIASTLYYEDRGISILFDQQQSALSYLENINSHIDNIIRYGADGQFHPVLIRDDYDVDTIPTIDESMMLDDPEFTRASWIDTINEVKVQYSDLGVERPEKAGILWGAGTNGSLGRLAVGTTVSSYSSPVESIATTKFLSLPKKAAAHCIAISEEGKMHGWGYHYSGAFGQSNDPGYSTTPITDIEDMVWVSCGTGRQYSYAIDENGELWGTGINTYGLLGIGNTTTQYAWIKLTTGEWSRVSGGYQNALAIKEDMTLWGCGQYIGLSQGTVGSPYHSYTWKQLGVHAGDLPGIVSGWVEVAVFQYGTAGINGDVLYVTGYQNDGSLGQGAADGPYYHFVSLGSGWADVCGYEANPGFIALKDNGDVYATGENSSGQYGQGNTNIIYTLTKIPGLPQIEKISTGDEFCALLDVDGHIWTCGKNDVGQLGLGHKTTPITTFTQIDNNVYIDISCGDDKLHFLKV